MPWLRVAALSAGVAAFQNAPQTKGALKSLRAAWLEEQQSVTGSDGKYGQSGTEAEVAAQAALDAIRADGRLALDAEAEQAAWEAAWIAATVANLERMKNEKDFAAQAVEVKGYVPPLGGKVSGAVESYAAASTGNMDHFASTAGSFKGKDRDFKSMGASSGPDWLSGSAAPAAAAPAAAVASPAASTGNMDHFASTAGSFKGKDRDFKSMGASSGPDWLSGSAAPAAAVASPAASTGNMDHFASTAGSFKGKDRDFKSMGASSGPDWLSGSAAPRPPPRGRAAAPAAAVASPAASTGNMDHFASTAGSFKGKDRDFKSMGASSGPDWLSGSAAPRPPPRGRAAAPRPRSRPRRPPRATWTTSPTAGSFKGKDRDFKSMGASSGPDWLSGSAAPRPRSRPRRPPRATWTTSASTAGSFKGKDRDFKSMGASSGPDWLSGSAAPRPPPRGRGRGKDRDFKSMGASSGPDWLSGSAAPAAAAPAAAVASPAASTGNMDHFASTAGSFKGKDRDFKSMGASSGPDWLSGSAAPAAAAPRPRSRPRRPPRATWTTSSTAGSFKGKDRDFKSMGASSGPDWLSGSAAPRPPPRGRGRGKDRDFKSMGAASGPSWLSGSAAPAAAVASPAASTGNMDHFASTAGSFKGKDRDFKSMGASSGPDWLSGSAAPRPPPRGRGRVPGGLHGQHGPLRPTAGSFKGKDRDFKSMGAASGPSWLSGSAAPAAAVASPAASTGNMDHFASTAGSFKGKDRDFKSMGASSGPDWLSGSAAPRPPPRGRGRVPGGLHGQHGPLRPRRARSRARTATSSPWAPRLAPTGSPARPPRGRRPAAAVASPAASTGNMDHFVHGGLVQGQGPRLQVHGRLVWPRLALRLGRPAAAAPAAVASPAASTGNMDHFASTAGSFKGKDRDFKSMGASSGPDWLSGSAAPAAAAPAAAVASPAASTGNMDHFASTAGSFKGKDRDFKSMGASSGPDWLSGSAAPRPPPRGRGRLRMAWLRLCALSAGVAAFQNNAPTTKRALEGLRAAWLEEQQSVAGLDGQSNDEAEVAARAALDAIRADGRLVNDAEAEQAAWEAAWIAVKVANLERLKNEKNFAAGKAAEDVKGYVPPLGGRAAGSLDTFAQEKPKAVGGSSAPAWLAGNVAGLGEQSAAEQALASMEQERVAAAAPAAAATSGSMDHFASTAGSFKGKDRDFKAMGAASGPEWLSGSAAPAAAPAATATPAKAAASGNMDHFASTAGSFKGKDRDFKAMGAVRPRVALRLRRPRGRRPAAASPAASTGSMDHFASTAGSFKGKDRDFKAMGAASGPEWLSGSAAPAAVAPAAASPAASTGNMDHFASTAGSFKGKDRDFKSMGAASGPDWLAGTPFATAAPVAPAAAPAKAAASGNMDHFASTAGSFKGKDRDFKSMGAASGPEWLSGSAAASSAPPATAAPAKAATGSMDHFASTAGSFKGKDRDFKSMGAASGPEWLSGSAAPAAAAPAAASPAASTGSMDHFASTAGSFKGKDRDFKAMGAASGPEWLSGSAAPAAAAPAAASPAASTGSMDHFASTAGSFKGKDRDFKAMGAASGPEWLSGSAAPAAAPAATAAPAKAAASGNMDHFASTAGSFKGKDRDFKAMGAASEPEWLSGSAAPAAAAPAASSPAASTGSMDHFASTAGSFKGKDRDFKAMGAASGPEWLSGSAAPAAAPAATAAPAKAAASGNMDHFASTAGSFKGKDRDFKSMGAASGPEWLSGSAAPAAAAPAAASPAASTGNMDHFASTAGSFKGKDRDFKAMGAASGPEWLSGSAAPAAAAPAAASPAASTGSMDHFASTAGSFKGKDRDFKSMGAASEPEWLSGSTTPAAAPAATAAPAKAASGSMDHFASTAGSFKGKDRDFKAMGAASEPEWLSGSTTPAAAPAATAAPAKAASGSMDHFVHGGLVQGQGPRLQVHGRRVRARVALRLRGGVFRCPAAAAPPRPRQRRAARGRAAPALVGFKGMDRGTWAEQSQRRDAWLSGTAAAAAAPTRAAVAKTATAAPAKAAPAAAAPPTAAAAPALVGFSGNDRATWADQAGRRAAWLSGTAAAAAAPAAPAASAKAAPAKAAASGNMDHFASHTAAVGGNKDHFASHIAAVAEAQAPQLSPAQAKRLSLRAKHHGFLEGPGRRTRQLRTPRSSPHSWTSFTN
ncbi:ATPase [Aureococcus anophagefferens]|nr:ATPase [Aureococcus anophagefferens]